MQPASTFMIRNRLVSSLIPFRAMNSLRLSLRHCTEEDWASSVIFIKIHMGAGQIAYSPSSSPCLKAVYKTMYFILLPSSAWMQDSLPKGPVQRRVLFLWDGAWEIPPGSRWSLSYGHDKRKARDFFIGGETRLVSGKAARRLIGRCRICAARAITYSVQA